MRVLEELSFRNNQIVSLCGIEFLTELQYVDFSWNNITEINSDDFKNNKKILELSLSENPIRKFSGLRNLIWIEYLDISNNIYVTNIACIPEISSLSKITAEDCSIKSLKSIHERFPNLNIWNFKNNKISTFEDIEDIKHFEYLAELDIRENPFGDQKTSQSLILTYLPELEVYNNQQLLEPGHKFKVETEVLIKEMEKTKYREDEDEIFEKMLEEAFAEAGLENDMKQGKDPKQEKQEKVFDLKKIKEIETEIEEDYHKSYQMMIESNVNISSRLVPLLGDENRMAEIENRTKEQLIKESIDFKKKIKNDYSDIRGKFRNVINKVRFDEMETFDQIRAQTAQTNKRDDPYESMMKEIKKLDEEARVNRAKFGFLTSRSMDSEDDENELEINNIEKENESMIAAGKGYGDRANTKNKKIPRGKSFINKNKSKEQITPFRSSAGFNNTNNELNTQTKSKKKIMRAESASKRKMPPSSVTKERLNELKEQKMNEEKDRIMNEFQKIVSKTTTSFKEPMFPNSTRKKVLEPIKQSFKDLKVTGDVVPPPVPLKNISKYSKPGMLSAQNDAIREMLRTKAYESEQTSK